MSEASQAPQSDSARSPTRKVAWLTRLEWFVVAMIVALLIALIFPDVKQVGPGELRRAKCRENMHWIGLALHNYHDEHGSFPPAYVADRNGRPIHSWRVLLLPYLDQLPLYRQYRFDEPWDGPNNRQLAEIVPDAYQCPSDMAEPGSAETAMTSYVAVVGWETAWPNERAIGRKDLTDRPSETLHVVEIANSGIHWMEPRDLHVGQMTLTINSKSGQGLSSKHKGGAVSLLEDSAVRFLHEKIAPSTMRALLTRAAGDVVGDF